VSLTVQDENPIGGYHGAQASWPVLVVPRLRGRAEFIPRS
jgi:hypothetical protein